MSTADFIVQLNKYKAGALKLLDAQPLAEYFKTTQKANVDYIARYYANWYFTYYGVVDTKKFDSVLLTEQELEKSLEINGDGGSTSPVIDSAAGMRVKWLSKQDKRLLNKMIFEDFDMSNEALFEFSSAYKMLYQLKLSILMMDKISNNPEGAMLSNLTYIIFNNITQSVNNTYIRESLLYEYILNFFEKTKDSEKAYATYMSMASDPIYKTNIKEVYDKMPKP
jgi:hypothetical protein